MAPSIPRLLEAECLVELVAGLFLGVGGVEVATQGEVGVLAPGQGHGFLVFGYRARPEDVKSLGDSSTASVMGTASLS